ncbi:7022_t:CDS:1, partial [Acaulospora morrowiae]
GLTSIGHYNVLYCSKEQYVNPIGVNQTLVSNAITFTFARDQVFTIGKRKEELSIGVVLSRDSSRRIRVARIHASRFTFRFPHMVVNCVGIINLRADMSKQKLT